MSRPQGVSGTCTAWRPAATIDPSAQPTDVGTFKIDPDGVTAILYFRDCADVRQFVWIRQEPPEVIADVALRDIRHRLLEPPEPATSPPGRAIVNLETWLSVADPGELSATASIPGLAATVTASVASTTWSFGHATGPGGGHGTGQGGVVVECEGVGTPWAAHHGDQPAPCGHTFEHHSDPNVGNPVAVTITWDVAWTATNGASGSLAPVVSDPAVFDLPVAEIQTIGTRG